jgi:hypothetical protein
VSNRTMRGIAKACLASLLGVSVAICAQTNQTMQRASPKPLAYGVSVNISRTPEGLDFSALADEIGKSIEREARSKITDAAEVVVQLSVQKDGNLVPESVKVRSKSGRQDMGAFVVAAVRRAAPFKKVPAQFDGPPLTVEVTVQYHSGSVPSSVIP